MVRPGPGTFTPTPGYTGSASVTVNNGSYTDLNGNVGTGNSDDTAIENPGPERGGQHC
ncbi:Ig-like domain-containing protein [Aeromonas veronii]|uniref:Ig-like domain-containing protein n=1 Tax=Aeromonas veronii TaxID=654 RepID=UPI001FFF0A7C|nr:Ig-like domain-containing protein [Aeromonas veronii]UPK54816.1 Ig-like domain-containing protein [Aeromonas veronii]